MTGPAAVQSVLFVCTANICRSAYAEVVTRHRWGGRVEIGSAGTHGWVDHPIDADMADELGKRGLEAGSFRSRRLTRGLVDAADLILTATAAHRTFVLEERPVAIRRVFSLGQLAAALAEVPVESPGSDLLAAARRARATASPRDDVADPFGRGPEAAAAAAQHIDDLLGQILPRVGV